MRNACKALEFNKGNVERKQLTFVINMPHSFILTCVKTRSKFCDNNGAQNNWTDRAMR